MENMEQYYTEQGEPIPQDTEWTEDWEELGGDSGNVYGHYGYSPSTGQFFEATVQYEDGRPDFGSKYTVIEDITDHEFSRKAAERALRKEKIIQEQILMKNGKFNLKKAITEAREHGRFTSEQSGAGIIEIDFGSRGEIDSVDLLHPNVGFEQYCVQAGKEIAKRQLDGQPPEDLEMLKGYIKEFGVGQPIFGTKKIVCYISKNEEEDLCLIDASKIDEDTKQILLDEETDDYEIEEIVEELDDFPMDR